MQDYNVLGIEKVSYKNKEGKQIKGVRLHLSFMRDTCDGLCVESVFVSEAIAEKIVVGSTIYLLYNKYGRIAQINIVG